MAKLGLVTVLFNSNDVLEDFFKSLAIQSYADYHLYIIDNSPSVQTDEIIEDLSRQYLARDKFTHIINTENNGVAKGNNQGIQLSLQEGAEYVILLNNDIYFSQPQLLQEMVERAEKSGEDLIIPKIFYYNTRTIWMAGGGIYKYRGYTSHYGEDMEDAELYSKEAYFEYAPTCFMLISKKVFDSVGLMDEKYFVYFDDTDFLVRSLKKGFKVLLLPKLEVFHKVAVSTGGGNSTFTIYYQSRNRIYFIKKNYNFTVRSIAILYTLATRMARYLQYDSKQKAALVKGLRDGFKIET